MSFVRVQLGRVLVALEWAPRNTTASKWLPVLAAPVNFAFMRATVDKINQVASVI